MGKTVGELLRSVSWRELVMWLAYMQLEPIGARRADLLTAHLLTWQVNANRKPDADPLPLSNFVLFDQLLEATRIESRDDSEDAEIDLTTVAYLIASAKQHDPSIDIPIVLDE